MIQLVANIMPSSLKQILVKNRMVVFSLYALRLIFKFDVLDKVVVRMLIEHNELEKALSIIKYHNCELDFCKLLVAKYPGMAESIILDHKEDVEYCRLLERFERFKALGENANERRLDFDSEKYNQLMKVSEDLVQQFPNDYLLHDRLARNNIAGGYRKKAKHHFSISLRSQREQKLLKGETGLIVFVTMPRSGSGYVSNALMNGLGLKNLNSIIEFIDAWFPDYGIFAFPNYVAGGKFSPMPDGFVHGHAAALEPNLWNLALITDKLIVNFRDPRQALISWVNYMEYFRFTGNISGLMEYQIPDGYFQWQLKKQLDWQIENYFVPINIEWIRGWLQADEDEEFPCEILFSKYEVLAKEPKRYFQEILSFYGLSEDIFNYPVEPNFKRKTHLRKGSTIEWMEILSSEQVQKINETIPKEWFDQFNWPRM